MKSDRAYVDVKLTPQEIALAAQVGVRRQISAIVKGLRDRNGCRADSGWQVHVEGACGEMAAAKAIGRFWAGSVDTFRDEADVGDYEVRTRSSHDYQLIVRDDDDPRSRYILVTGLNGTYRVHGWLRGIEARRPEWRKNYGDRGEAYFVPTPALHDLAEIR